MDIKEIRESLITGVPVEYKAHCLKRMFERNITMADVRNCILTGEIIDDYPLDETNTSEQSFSSCLILGMTVEGGRALHVVIGYNGHMIIVITAYFPDLEHFHADFKTRR